ncbi:MAG TPA: hypothetical protein PLS67_03585 [Accumulibacter sp.]|jgi:hypothetical protein|nr:hypothetical protein [Accumulibacter sp.]HQC79590.1 hypothetical protein [Accumulibacter sp.]
MKFPLAVIFVVLSQMASAQVSIDLSGISVKTGPGSSASGSKNTVSNEKGVIGPGADVEGVVIINDEVYIDGNKIARGVTQYVSKKTKTVYAIRWGKKGEGVTVTEK